jgi:hypothetical protein
LPDAKGILQQIENRHFALAEELFINECLDFIKIHLKV